MALIRAENDLEAILLWLANYVDSPATHANYRKEADRLLLWALADALAGPVAIAQDDLRLFRAFLATPERSNPIWTLITQIKPVSSLTHEDLTPYRQFLADPQPTSTWVTENGARFATDDPRWRPFAGKLEPASVKQAVVILDSMFGWLVESGYLRGNPLGLLRQRRRRPTQRVTRFLPAVMWQHVKDYIAAMPQSNRTEQRDHARARWLTTLLYQMGLRISEVAAGTMGNFVREIDAGGTQRWWLEVVGKGQKYRRIPVSEELLAELLRYHQVHGLTPLPVCNELPPCSCPSGDALATLRAMASIAKRCTTRSRVFSSARPTGRKTRARNTSSTLPTFAKRRRTGCDIPLPRICWTARWICGPYGTILAMTPSTLRANTRMKKTIAAMMKRHRAIV